MVYDKINVLDIITAIRTRSSMYIGSTETPMQLFFEVLGNGLDEAICGHVSEIRVTTDLSTNALSVQDNGRGFPSGYHPDYEGLYHLDVALTVAHAGSKFSKESYALSSGLHGLGLTCCTALCDEISVESVRDKFTTKVVYQDAQRISGERIDTSKFNDASINKGTIVKIIPSSKYFRSVTWDNDQITDRIKLALLFIPKVKIYFNDQEIKPYELSELAPKCDDQLFDVSCTTPEGESARAMFGYGLARTDRNISRGAVNLLSVDNGVHIRLFERAITDAWSELVDKDLRNYLTPSDYTLGISGFILVNLLEPSYTSQTKETLAGSLPDYKTLAASLKAAITKDLKKRWDTKFVQALLHRFKDYRKSLNEMSSSKYIDELVKYGDVNEDGKVTRSSNLESKLVDCRSSDRDSTELFICLRGDTRIPLLNGKVATIKELAESDDKEYWVYSHDGSNFVPGRAHSARVTSQSSNLIKVDFEGGSVVCTPTHKFMTREGNYIRARDLTEGESLMSITRMIRDDYEHVYFDNTYVATHRIVASSIHSEAHDDVLSRVEGTNLFDVVHHVNFDRRDNTPSNLVWMDNKEHFRYHSEVLQLNNLELAKLGRHPWQSEAHRLRMSNRLIRLAEIGEHPAQQSDYKVRQLARHADLTSNGKHYFQTEAARRNSSKRLTEYNQSEEKAIRMSYLWSTPEGREKFISGVKRYHEVPHERTLAQIEGCNRSREVRTQVIDSVRLSYVNSGRASSDMIRRNSDPLTRKQQVVGRIAKLGSKILHEGLPFNEESWKKLKNGSHPKWENLLRYFSSEDELVEYCRNYNHKVLRITEISLSEPEDVYCMTVDTYSNFMIEGGIISHNCEGQSAGGNLINQRDVRTQAVLPLKGKSLNVVDQDLQRILNNIEMRSLINSLGVGVRHKEVPEKCRYGKIIIASDSDLDGLQIQALLIGALCYLTPGIVREGRVWIAEAPLFGQRDKRGRFTPVWDQKDLKSGLQTFRFKGLGSMDADEIKEVLLNPNTRRLQQIELDDVNQVLRIVGNTGYKKELMIERGLLK